MSSGFPMRLREGAEKKCPGGAMNKETLECVRHQIGASSTVGPVAGRWCRAKRTELDKAMQIPKNAGTASKIRDAGRGSPEPTIWQRAKITWWRGLCGISPCALQADESKKRMCSGCAGKLAEVRTNTCHCTIGLVGQKCPSLAEAPGAGLIHQTSPPA